MGVDIAVCGLMGVSNPGNMLRRGLYSGALTILVLMVLESLQCEYQSKSALCGGDYVW